MSDDTGTTPTPEDDWEAVAWGLDCCNTYSESTEQHDARIDTARDALGSIRTRLAELQQAHDYYKSVHDEMLPTTRHDAVEAVSIRTRLAEAEAAEREHELSGDCWCGPRIEHVPGTTLRTRLAEAEKLNAMHVAAWESATEVVDAVKARAERAEAALREIAGNDDYAEDDVLTRLVNRQNIARRALEQGDE